MISKSVALLASLQSLSFAIPIDIEIHPSAIKPAASNVFSPQQDVLNLINGSGLNGDQHDNEGSARTMWHTAENPVASAIAGVNSPAWVRFDFSTPQAFDRILIWNHNQSGLTNRGFRKTRILGTVDGANWKPLAEIELPLANGSAAVATSVAVSTKQAIKSVVIAAESNWGGNVYGLSEVKFVATKDVAEADLPFPDDLDCNVSSIYRHLPDGSAGREIILSFKGAKLYAAAEVEITVEGQKTTRQLAANLKGLSEAGVLLPAGVGLEKGVDVSITISSQGKRIVKAFNVPKQRQWTIYLFPHSHVDIGYTNPQAVVEKIHMRNMDVGLELGQATAAYPEGSRHVWNNEVLWGVDSWLGKATSQQKALFIDAVKKGQIGLNASYANLNTTVASDEELLRDFACAKRLRSITGAPIDTMCQFDIPGLSWGIVQAAAQNGVRAILDFPNPSDRTGTIHTWRNKPFYWVAPDGKTRVLYLQFFPYNLAWKLGAYAMNPKPYEDAPGRDRIHFVDTPNFDRHSEVGPFRSFILGQTAVLEKSDYPYDINAYAWSLSDNCPVDVGLPDFVKKWNTDYAYPKLVIADAHTIAQAFEKKFGSIIPEQHGDLTEYWTDGLGTDALRTGYNRPAKESLVQSEILAAMIGKKDPVSGDERYAAWRWIQMGTEHTWGYMNPGAPIAKSIEATKASYFENARDASREILGRTLRSVTKPGSGTLAVLNTLSWPRDGLVVLPENITTIKGITAQKLSTGETVFLAKDIPAMGSKIYQAGPSFPSDRSDLLITSTTLENAFVKLTLDTATGDITSLVDKRTRHDFAGKKERYALNSFRYLRGGDAPEKATAPTDVRISIKENGPVLASLLVESKAEGCNRLTREIRLIAGQPQIEILNIVDKVSTRNKEGVHFAFSFNLPESASPRMDIPWGVMNPLTEQLPGANKNWLACQRWVDVSSADLGVTWLPIEASVFQFGDITANLLGSVNPNSWSKKIGDTRTIVSWALNNHWHTNFPLEQGGVIPFHYAILPHGAYDPVVVNRFGLEQNRPLVAVRVDSNPVEKPLVSVDNPRVFVSTMKLSNDGASVILRLRSLSDKSETVRLSYPGGSPKSLRLSDATEIPGEITAPTVTMLPYGITTFHLEFGH